MSKERRQPRKRLVEEAAERRNHPRLAVRKKLSFALLTTALFFLAVELALTASGFRTPLDEEDPYVGFSSYAPLFLPERGTEPASMRTARNKRPWFNEQQFLQHKPPNVYRTFCLGGSTTFGRPYDDATSFCGWLREFLPAADGSRSWEVIYAGGVSYASYRVANVMQELAGYEPDLFVIYTGHNEFLEERTYGHLRDLSPTQRLTALLSQSRTYGAITSLLASSGLKSPSLTPNPDRRLLPEEVKTLLDSAIGPDVYRRDETLRRGILQHFEFNLRRMIDIAERAGASVIFVTPASNLRDCSPFKSQHRDGLTPGELDRWERLYAQAAQAHRSGRFNEALAALDAATALDDRYADLIYLRGQALLALGRYDQAKAEFVRARDEDVCPLRASTEMQDILWRVAAERGVPVLDFVAQLERQAEHGIAGEDLFLDHVHPTIDGHRTLGLLLLEQMALKGMVHPSDSWGEETILTVTSRVKGNIDQTQHAAALRNLSKVLGWAGKMDEADGLALRAAGMLPEDASAQYQAGNAYFRRGDLDNALAHYQRSLQLDPNSAQAHYGLGLTFNAQGEGAAASEHYEQALRLDPNYVDAHYNLAILLEAAGELETATVHFQHAIQLQPRDWFAYNNLGIALAKQGRLAEAKTQFEQALRLQPDFADAYFNLGRVCLQQGDREVAIECFRKVLQSQPDHAGAAEQLRVALQQRDDRP